MRWGEGALQAARRELYEETRCLYPVDDVLPEIDGDRRIEAGSFVAFVVEPGRLGVDEDEAGAVAGGGCGHRGVLPWRRADRRPGPPPAPYPAALRRGSVVAAAALFQLLPAVRC